MNLMKNKLWFVQKTFDIPVQIYYLREDILERGPGHALSFVSPVVFFIKYFTS